MSEDETWILCLFVMEPIFPTPNIEATHICPCEGGFRFCLPQGLTPFDPIWFSWFSWFLMFSNRFPPGLFCNWLLELELESCVEWWLEWFELELECCVELGSGVELLVLFCWLFASFSRFSISVRHRRFLAPKCRTAIRLDGAEAQSKVDVARNSIDVSDKVEVGAGNTPLCPSLRQVALNPFCCKTCLLDRPLKLLPARNIMIGGMWFANYCALNGYNNHNDNR